MILRQRFGYRGSRHTDILDGAHRQVGPIVHPSLDGHVRTARRRDRALTVFLEHHVHICDGAQRKGRLRVSQAVDVLRDLLQPLVQLDGLAEAFLPANVPACMFESSRVDHSLCLDR